MTGGKPALFRAIAAPNMQQGTSAADQQKVDFAADVLCYALPIPKCFAAYAVPSSADSMVTSREPGSALEKYTQNTDWGQLRESRA